MQRVLMRRYWQLPQKCNTFGLDNKEAPVYREPLYLVRLLLIIANPFDVTLIISNQ